MSILDVIMNKIKGDEYELFIMEHLIKELGYDKAWLWKNIPEKILFSEAIIKDYNDYLDKKNDIGIDILALKDDKYTYIQCKNYENTICIQDLAGYFFFKTLFPNKKYKVFYNGNLSSRIKKFVESDEYVHVPFKINNNGNTNRPVINLVPRDYQLEAINLLKNKKRSIISLPCGMGKTYISLILAKLYDNIIFFAPTKELSLQTFEFFSKLLDDYKCNLISGDGDRNLEKIKISNKNLFVSTFKSCDIISVLIKKLNDPFIIIDEYHNLSENDVYNNKFPFYGLLNSNYKILFLSATPKYLDNSNILGNTIYRYDWNRAIENKYITDFEIILPTDSYLDVNFNDFISMFSINKNVDPTECDLIKKMYFIIRSLLFNGNKKCIIYLLDTNIASKCNNIIQWMSLLFKRQIVTNIIDYKTDRKIRKQILTNFITSNEINILLNVHVLDEGIDIPACDSVFITNPSYNIQNIVQRMSRCNRIYPGKDKSHIYLWTNKEKTKEILDYINNNTNNEFNYKYNMMDFNTNSLVNKKDVSQNNKAGVKLNRNKLNKNILINKSKYYCELCDYSTDNRICWHKHKKAIKHKNIEKLKTFQKQNEVSQVQNQIDKKYILIDNKMDNHIKFNNQSKYYCELCNYSTDNRICWHKHKQTIKHKNIEKIKNI